MDLMPDIGATKSTSTSCTGYFFQERQCTQTTSTSSTAVLEGTITATTTTATTPSLLSSAEAPYEEKKEEEELQHVVSVDALLSNALKELTVDERENVYNEIHCVSGSIVDELSSYPRVTVSIESMVDELNQIHPKNAYDLAFSLSESYVTNLRLPFLRAESFNPKLAAKRIVQFFEQKLIYFGVEKLTKDINLTDLDDEAIQFLNSGFFQCLPGRDRAGRSMFCVCVKPEHIMGESKRKMRAMYFMFQHLWKDEENQKRGVVALLFHSNPPVYHKLSLLKKGAKFRNSFPLRIASCHLCFDNPLLYPFISFALRQNRSGFRARVRAHFGSLLKCHSKLSTFGIPPSSLPFTSNGEFRLDHHREWLRKQWYNILGERSEGGGGPSLPTHNRRAHVGEPARNLKDCVNGVIPSQGRMTQKERKQNDGKQRILESHSTTKYSAANAQMLRQQHETRMHHQHESQQPTPPPTFETTGSLNWVTTIPASPEEVKNDSRPIRAVPRLNDVLFGRGKPLQRHTANIRYRKLVDAHMHLYCKAACRDKPKVSCMIVQLVKETTSGRFLKLEKDGSWVEVDDTEARKKVSHDFRNRRDKYLRSEHT